MSNDFGVIAATLHAFYSGFGVPAYPENHVPEKDENGGEIQPPYITYTIVCPPWREAAVHQARVWTRSESFLKAAELTDRVLEAIGDGVTLDAVGGKGYVTLDPGSPLAQVQPMDEPLYKVAYINLVLGAITARGE